jgi:uncharacterized protein
MDLKLKNPQTNAEIICQASVVNFLNDRQSYQPPPADVEHIETHGAHVFLAGDTAFKIKRAIKLPYLDFSTLEHRRMMCEREFQLNHANAPQIYRGVLPITLETTGNLCIAGDGPVVEWALEMTRFADECLLSRFAERGAISDALSKDLADTIENFHQQLKPIDFVDCVQFFEYLIDQLSSAFRSGLAPFSADDCNEFDRRARDALSSCEHCLILRAKRGYIRRCHGDLHLSNIVVLDGKPVLFDAIEFDEKLATIDVLYDLAFLLMDLVRFGLKRQANVVLNQYLYRSDDATSLYGLKALPLFLGFRAAIRAMVSIDRGKVAGAKSAAMEDAQEYFSEALDFLKPPAPRLIAVGGLSGTGKSTLAAAIAPDIRPVPGAIHLRTDMERKAMLNVEETFRLKPEFYTKEYSECVYDIIFRKAAVTLKAGHSVIVDAVFSDPAERTAIRDVAARLNVPFSGIWLSAPQETSIGRVAARKGDASDATPEIVEMQFSRGTGPIAWPVVDARGSPDDVRERAALCIEDTELHALK